MEYSYLSLETLRRNLRRIDKLVSMVLVMLNEEGLTRMTFVTRKNV